MAHFYAEVQGNRGPASRMGAKGSGIWGHVRGWGAGVRVSGFHDPVNGRDTFHVYATGGSGGQSRDRLIAVVTDTAQGPEVSGVGGDDEAALARDLLFGHGRGLGVADEDGGGG